MASGDHDHPNVVVRPPILYLGALGASLLGESVWPLGSGLLGGSWAQIAVGILMVVSGAVLLGLAAGRFRRAETNIPTVMPTLALVTAGPYAWSRNPIYIALTAVYAGLAIALNAWWAVVLVPIVLAIMRYGVVAREEAYLAAKFPDEYSAYRARVRRWL